MILMQPESSKLQKSQAAIPQQSQPIQSNLQRKIHLNTTITVHHLSSQNMLLTRKSPVHFPST